MKHERGFGFLHLILALIVVVAALGFWKHQSKKMAAQAAEQFRLETEQKRKVSEEREALAKRLEEEREALAKRQEEEKRKDEFEKSIASLKGIRARWQDAERLAQSTSRIALAQPVASLQQIKRETEGIVAPPCLNAAKGHLVRGMKWTIEGFIQFMTDKKFSEFTTPPYFEAARKEFSEYESSKDSCQ